MGKGLGQFFGAILGAMMPWIFMGGLVWVYWPQIHLYWASREQAFALVPQLQATIAADRVSLKTQKDLCRLGAARAQRTGVLVDKLAAAPADGVDAAGIQEILAP